MIIKNDSAFWNEFKLRSDNMLKPFYYPGFLVDSGEVRRLLNGCFENIVSFPEHLPQMRIFDDRGGIRLDLFEILISKKPFHIESLDLWIQQSFKISQFCVAFKNITKYHSELEDIFFHSLVQPYINQFGIPGGGFEFYCFIGNYGFTPFGIHKDAEHSLLVNLGPGMKKVWAWNPENYIRYNSSLLPKIIFDQQFLNTADYYVELKEGDFYHIPEGMYHVLYSESFSCMLGLIPYPTTISDLLERTYHSFNDVINDLGDGSQSKIDGYIAGHAVIEPANAICYYTQLLKSNGFLASPPHVISKEFDKDNWIKSVYPIFYRPLDNLTLEIMGRMSVFNVPYATSIVEVLDGLNLGKEFSIAGIMRIMEDELENDLIEYIIGKLVSNQITKITK